VTGPQIVAEVYGLKDESELQGVLDNYKPDYLEMGVKELSLFASLPLPVIIALDTEQELRFLRIEPAYLISRILINTSIPVLVKVESRAAAQQMLDDNRLKGIVLQGGSEVRPGLKNYELMNEVLELLEAED
jgi:phosphoribosylanthranilate isomerase